MKSANLYAGKTVLVTGSSGTVGAELVRTLLRTETKKIVCIDSNETDLFFQQEEHKATRRVYCHLGDVRDRASIADRMRGVDVVLHAAALKHVGLCEDSPLQAVNTNILGTQNVIDAALEHGVERVIFTSSDKAVNPTNVMGTSKLMGERLMTAAALRDSSNGTIFASTRFGNVLGSRGSVIPIFRNQAEAGGPITLTDASMTRFIMSLQESVHLVLDSVWLAVGGEVLVAKMPVARISDLAEIFRSKYSVPERPISIEEIGSKPGEKMYEELMNDEEVRRARYHEDFIVILSAFSDPEAPMYAYLHGCDQPSKPYNSNHEEAMTLSDVERYLQRANIAI